MEMGELEKAISRGGDAMMTVTGEPCGLLDINLSICQVLLTSSLFKKTFKSPRCLMVMTSDFYVGFKPNFNLEVASSSLAGGFLLLDIFFSFRV